MVKQEAVPVKAEIIDLEDDTYSGNEASTTSSKTCQANGYLADGQSPRPWDSTTLPPPTPPLPPPQKTQFLPLPGRPAFLTETTRQQTHSPVVPRARRDASRRSSGLRAPAIATSLPRGKVADFFPWTGIAGAHSEDVMNESTVKSGNNDKAQNANSPNIAAESNTARPTLWPSLKGKNGLHVLSALFCQVLDKRQQMGRCTAPSTFKPPPRVTLTDTKREAWLKDLANPDVPLRRLSRTIPHGIRGKVLLDHCITKEIPIARAVWLSKCVGANEIRAFKRKGVSGPSALAGEIKWVREWTVCVEQFVEGVIGECGHSGWSRKMNYAIRLATFFFSEHLLDGEHYIDWILTSLETATTERLPVWVLITQVYWKHMVSQRKRGRRLSEALLAHAHILMRTEYTSIAPLVDRLQQLISILAIAHQGCLVMPKTWKDKDVTFESIASLDRFAQAKDAMHNVEKRNIRILGGMNLVATTHVKQNLVDMLDRVQFDGQIPLDILPSDSSLQDCKLILSVMLEWATSRHREGMARIYLTARILRQWNIAGADTDGVILDTLEAATADPSIDNKPLHEVVALLARSSHFSVGKYLQWLISVG
ncbi:transcription mediator complex subunit Med12-domain-containing protein, partial [Delphinella strobiligena]